MTIALIITVIALQIGQWLYSKKCIDRLKTIAQEWRETAEAYKDELERINLGLPLAKKPSGVFNTAKAKPTKTHTKGVCNC
jgi:hypothetical protein